MEVSYHNPPFSPKKRNRQDKQNRTEKEIHGREEVATSTLP